MSAKILSKAVTNHKTRRTFNYIGKEQVVEEINRLKKIVKEENPTGTDYMGGWKAGYIEACRDILDHTKATPPRLTLKEQ